MLEITNKERELFAIADQQQGFLELPIADLIHFAPIALLNGQLGLDDDIRDLANLCAEHNIEYYKIDNLFEDLTQLTLLSEKQVKTVVLGTTGFFRDELNNAINYFKTLSYLPIHVFFTFGSDYFQPLTKHMKQFYPDAFIGDGLTVSYHSQTVDIWRTN